MKKRLLPMILVCCLLAAWLAVSAGADGAPVSFSQDGEWFDAWPGKSETDWSFQSNPSTFIMNNFHGEYLSVNIDTAIYGDISIRLAEGTVNTLNQLTFSDGKLIVKGNGTLIIKVQSNMVGGAALSCSSPYHAASLQIEEPLKMLGGTKESDRKPLTINDGKAVASDGTVATYVVITPSGNEENVPAFPVDSGDPSQRAEFPDVPSDISYGVVFRSEEKYELNKYPISTGNYASGNVVCFQDKSQDRYHRYQLMEYTGSGIQAVSDRYSSISSFSDSGYAGVSGYYTSTNGHQSYGYGIIDKTGKLVAELGKYSDIPYGDFTDDGYATVSTQYDNFLLNLKDGTSIKLEKAGAYGGYNNGLIPFYESLYNKDRSQKYTWKYLDISQKVVFDTQIEDVEINSDSSTYAAGTFSHGYAVVRPKVNDKRVYEIIDTTGKATFTDTAKKYRGIGKVSAEGLAVAQVSDDVYDYIDTRGNVVIPGGYSQAEMFRNGYAVVDKPGKQGTGGRGIIDTKGHVVVPFGTYDYLSNVSDTGLVWAVKTNYDESSRTFYGTLEILKVEIRPIENIPADACTINRISLSDSNGNTLNALPAASCLVTLSVTNVTGSPTVLLASFTAAGQYQGLTYTTVTESNQTVEVTLPVDNSGGKIAQLKAFAVNSFADMTMIGNPVSFPA